MADPDVPASAAALDDALAQLEGLAGRGVEEHPAAFERVHATMRAVLDGDDS